MNTTAYGALLVIALILLGLAALNVPKDSKINMGWAGVFILALVVFGKTLFA